MLEQLKKIVKQTEEANVPARFLFGEVKKLSPLTVLVDNRFYLSPPALVVLKEMYGHKHLVPGHSTEVASNHSHGVKQFDSNIAEALKVGDKVDTYFMSNDIRVRPLKVAGIFNSHFDSYDDIYVYGDLSLIQHLGGISGDQGTMLSIHTDDFNRVTEYSERLHNTLLEAMANGTVYRYYGVDNAYIQGQGYFHWLDLLDTNVVVILTLMAFVAVVTLISGMLIIIIDKKRFIGLIRSLGASVKATRKVFLYLAMRVGLLGMLIGNVVALGVLMAEDKWHFLPLDAEAYYIDFVPVELGWLPVLLLNAGVVLLIWLSLILPSRFVAKIPPAETMRTEE